MYLTLVIVGLTAGFLSGSIGFGGGMIIIPVITYFYGVESAVPLSTTALLLSNLSRCAMAFKEINWKAATRFLLFALPFTVLGSLGFTVVNKVLLTRLLSVFLIVFAIFKLTGKKELPSGKKTVIIGGGLSGLLNGMLGISGPISSAVFLTLDLTPVAYIGTESAAAAIMHMVKAFVYGKFDLITGDMFVNGVFIGCAMILGNFFAMKLVRHVNKKPYRMVVASFMMIASVYLFVSVE